jgi:flagellar hook-associated protein 2
LASVTSTGVGSGLDVNGIVTSLMALERRPLNLLEARAGTIQTRISAFGALKGQVAALGDLAAKLADPATWNPTRIDSTSSDSVSATATSAAVAGKHRLEVQQLAQAQSLASGSYAAATSTVGTGTLTIALGTTSGGVFTPRSGATPVTVTIGAGQNTLAGVRDAINASKAGVTASIVTSGGSSRLVLRGADGADASVRITASDDDGNATDAAGLSALAWDPAAAAGAGRNLTQTQAAQDALYTLDGLSLASATNSPTGVLEGVTLQLKKVTTAPVDLTVSIETMAVRKNVNDFVNAYNSLSKLLVQQTQADPSGVNRGPLQADSTAVALLSSLRQMVTGTLSGGTGPASLNAAGIEMQRDGTLAVKDARLTPLLEQPSQLARLFGQAQSGGDTATLGLGHRFEEWADALTADTGSLAGRIEGLQRSVDLNQKQQESLQDRLTRTEDRIRAQYQRLDTEMTRLNAEMARMRSTLGLA